ncbi:MAG: type II toxin-antitoxin system HicA family toxin [Planctomycetia bacterium]|nr:type II toxin-antitoxin system HicA family toxin [Planctomycetia bacterium]
MKHFKVREIVKQIEADGWFRVDSKGGHLQFQHPMKKGKVAVPTSKNEISGWLLKEIERQSQIKFK